MSRQETVSLNTKELNKSLVTKTPDLTVHDPVKKKEEIRRYFHNTVTLFESLFDCLQDDSIYYFQPNPLRHPHIFYFGHTAVFYINKLRVAGHISERLDPEFESKFAIGVDEMSWDDVDQGHYDWPSVDDVRAYRNKMREIVDRVIQECNLSEKQIGWSHPLWIVMMGIEHERIHLETSSVLIRETPLDKLKPHPVWGNICREHGEAPENQLLPVPGGSVQLGKDHTDPYYGWDNEYGHLKVEVSDFQASQYLVSNREFLGFIKDGGYQNQEYWTEEGWGWVTYKNAKHPVYWIEDGDTFRYRTMLEEVDLPWDWPAHVNALEAQAFCKWKSQKTGKNICLPTEAQWYQLRSLEPSDQPDWEKAPGNLNLEYEMSSCPVTRHAFAHGFYDIVGNAWQWTRTAIHPFEGFEIHPAYDDFSVPTFDGKHDLFKGGCWISTGNYALRLSRYAFRRHFFQHAGFRYIEETCADRHESTSEPNAEENIYNRDAIIAEYAEFHYGDTHFNVPNFQVKCAGIAVEAHGNGKRHRALDLGCATGRAAFEFAKHFDWVDGVDFTARLLQVPSSLQSKGSYQYEIPSEGEIVIHKEIHLAELGYQGVKDKVAFQQGDACNLPEKYKDYDLVLALNLLDQLYDPEAFLCLIQERIQPGGTLVLGTSCAWSTEFTPREKWLGGFCNEDGTPQTTLDGIRKILTPAFEQVGDALEVPFVIRETQRTFQHSHSQISIWRRR